jgi:hypothetical protein
MVGGMEPLRIVDVDGVPRYFDAVSFYTQLAQQDFKLFGMTVPVILKLREEYQKLAGPEPMTEESVEAVFAGAWK